MREIRGSRRPMMLDFYCEKHNCTTRQNVDNNYTNLCEMCRLELKSITDRVIPLKKGFQLMDLVVIMLFIATFIAIFLLIQMTVLLLLR